MDKTEYVCYENHMKNRIQQFRFFLVALLLLLVVAASVFSLIHNHFNDLGTSVDLLCPLCSFVLGFVFCCLSIVAFVIAAYGLRPVLPCYQTNSFSGYQTPTAPRPPPAH